MFKLLKTGEPSSDFVMLNGFHVIFFEGKGTATLNLTIVNKWGIVALMQSVYLLEGRGVN